MFVAPCASAVGDGALLSDDTQGKGACDGVKDDGARGLGDGPPTADVESDQRGNVVKAILLELEQLP